MKVLVTGAFGNVGRSTLSALLAAGDEVSVLEADTRRNRKLGKSWSRRCRVFFGDVRDPSAARRAIEGQEAVIHLAALIPPAADRNPELTRSINIGGTANLIAAAKDRESPPRLVLASSVAAYGDRLARPWISTEDELEPNADDVYGQTKVEAERLLRESGLPFVVLRLSYVIWSKWIKKDPLMFHMPPATGIEACHTEDTGRAFAAAARLPAALGLTFDIGGGTACRTSFRAYLDRMFAFFGLGDSRFLPDEAFASSGFHCGFYTDSDRAEEVLHFRRKTMEDYYAEVERETRALRPWAAFVAPIIKRRLLAESPFLKKVGAALAPRKAEA
jgi:nucleoside-diphosphate-sugar epimerase